MRSATDEWCNAWLFDGAHEGASHKCGRALGHEGDHKCGSGKCMTQWNSNLVVSAGAVAVTQKGKTQ